MKINGIIVKGIGGFYYVKTEDKNIYECKARGIFRKDNIVPAVGDRVLIDAKENGTGVIDRIFERKNYMIRPPVANIDLAVIVFAFTKPEPNLQLLDRFLVTVEKNEIQACVCINKLDLITNSEKKDELFNTYRNAGYDIIFTSTKTKEGISELKKLLMNHISIFAGPSGVGKSSLLNEVQHGFQLRTGNISEKAERGKHTTRHVELLDLDFGGSVLDTPGFTSLEISDIEEEEIAYCFPEFLPHIEKCRFKGCRHLHEPQCEIKNKVALNEIAASRYESYVAMLKEIEEQRRHKYD